MNVEITDSALIDIKSNRDAGATTDGGGHRTAGGGKEKVLAVGAVLYNAVAMHDRSTNKGTTEELGKQR